MNVEILRLILVVLLSLFGLAFLFGLGLVLFIIGKRSVINNPNKAAVFIASKGKLERPKKGQFLKGNNKGRIYTYNKDKQFTIRPNSYSELWFEGRLAIFLNSLGQIISSPFDNKEILSDTEKSDLIYSVIETHVGADVIHAMTSRKKMPNIILIIIIVVVLAVVGILGYQFYQRYQAQQQQPQQQQQQQTPDNNLEIEVN